MNIIFFTKIKITNNFEISFISPEPGLSPLPYFPRAKHTSVAQMMPVELNWKI